MGNWKEIIPNDWKIEKFYKVALLRHGYQFRNYDFTDEGVKVFKITQIKGEGIADISSCSFIASERLDNFIKFIIKKGDILVALTGATIGKIAKYNLNEVILQNYRVGNFFPIDENVLSKEYLFQFLRSKYFFNQIIAGQTQSAQQNIGKEDINNMSLILPDINEQLAIASILSALDDKIELNLQMNKILEEMSMALYKHWFIEFGPFQDGEFVESELGMIPKGWEVKNLDEVIEFKNQGVNTTTEKVKYSEKGIPVIRANNISANYIDTNNLVYVDETTFKKVRTQCKPKLGDVLYTNIGSQLGNASLSFMDYEYLIAWNVLRLKVNEYIYSPELLVTFFNNPMKREEIRNLNSSSTMPFVSGKVLGKIQIIVPDTNNLKIISKELKYFYSLINLNIKENQTLTTLRDTLIPKLISGEVRIKDIEQTISNVL